MGSTCCSKIYYLNMEYDEIYTGNFDSRRQRDENCYSDYEKTINKPISYPNSFIVPNTPQNPFVIYVFNKLRKQIRYITSLEVLQPHL